MITQVKTMDKQFGITHGIAQCQDCNWRNEQYKNAQATAALHAKKFGHHVTVEIVLSGYYKGKKK